MTKQQQRGQAAEQLAAEHLQQSGYTILDRNWHCPYGELDIIAKQDDTIVIVEVRARTARSSEAAFESIGPRKRERLATAALVYLSEQGLDDAPWRLDAVAVVLRGTAPPHIEHVENALDW
jgi:putative endonuclease